MKGGISHHAMVAPKLQQFQYDLKKRFLWHLQCQVPPVLFGPNDSPRVVLLSTQNNCPMSAAGYCVVVVVVVVNPRGWVRAQ